MDLSIITINYHTEELLKKCIASILSSHPTMKYEIIVVDNESTKKLIIKNPNIRIITNKENVGYGKANNQAVKVAKGEYMLFLNVDTEVQDNAINKLFKFIRSRADAHIVGGKLLNTDMTDQASCGPFYTLPVTFGMLFLKGDSLHVTRSSPDSIKKVDWISGACMLMKKKTFESLNGFDEGIFMYMEEVEFLYRTKKKGFHTYFYPDARIMHVGAAASGSRKTPVINIFRGLLYFYKKHYSASDLAILKLMLKTKAAISYILGALTNNSYLRETYATAYKLVG